MSGGGGWGWFGLYRVILSKRRRIGFWVSLAILAVVGTILEVFHAFLGLSLTDLLVYLLIAALGEAITLLVIVLGWTFSPEIKGWITSRGVSESTSETVVLDVKHIPAHRGYTLMPNRVKLDGRKGGIPLTHGPYSDDDTEGATSSQLWDAHPPIVKKVYNRDYIRPSDTRPLIYQFGVLRVHAIGGAAYGCRATAQWRHLEKNRGKWTRTGPSGMGQLRWFSRKVRGDIMGTDIQLVRYLLSNPQDGLNRLINQSDAPVAVTINPGTYQDLPLFYVRKDYPAVWLCGEVNGLRAGECEGKHGRRMVHFELEVTISAENCTARTWKYTIGAVYDGIRITELV